MQLPDTVTLAQAASLLPQLEAAVAAVDGTSGRFMLDASRLASFDTSALALMLQGRRLAEARGLRFELHGLPEQLRELALLYGVAELLSESTASPSAAAARSVTT